MSHYFTNDVPKDEQSFSFKYTYAGRELIFENRSGVFSASEADYASRLLIECLPEIEGRLLDLGCGCGLIGIALACRYGVDVTCADVNERAVELARLNASANGLKGTFIASDGFESIDGHFDAITLNPPIHAGKAVCERLYEQSAAHLTEGGAFYAVIQKKHGAASAERKLREIYGTVGVLYKAKGFFVYECKT